MATILQDVSLKTLNTFGLEARTKYYTEIHTLHDLQSAIEQTKGLPLFVLGGGSNILFTQDFEGITLRINLKGVTKTKEDSEYVWLKVAAGEHWHDFVLYAIEKNYAGIENLSLIPGTVGAAPMQNIGAYGIEIQDVFQSLEAYHIATGEIHTFEHSQCQFGYRESIFKNQAKGQYIILNVVFRLNKTPTFRTDYGDIQKIIAQNSTPLSIKAISDAVIQIRQSKLPNPVDIGNAGSFFKNPEIEKSQYDSLKSTYPQLSGWEQPSGKVKIAAGWLIQQAGWKGFRRGNIGVHTQQALVLVNYGGGTGLAIKALSEEIQYSVWETFGIQLRAEVNFL